MTFIWCICVAQVCAQEIKSYASSTISIPVSDLNSSTEWYQQLLGDVESFSPAEGVVEFMLNEKTWLQLFEGEVAANAILRLEVMDIKMQYNRLRNLKLSPSEILLVPNVVSYIDFKDPDGNQLSFYQIEEP